MKKSRLASNIQMLCRDFWVWIRVRPVNVVIAANVFLAVIIGLVMFINIVLPTLILGVLVIIVFKDELSGLLPQREPPPLTLYDDAVCWEITKLILDSYSSVSSALNEFVHAPNNANDMYNTADFRGVYNDATILKLHFLRKQKDISNGDCDYIKNVLQSAVDGRLRDGYLSGCAWAVPVIANVPIVKISSIECSALYINVDILLTNETKSVNAAQLSDKPSQPLATNDADSLF